MCRGADLADALAAGARTGDHRADAEQQGDDRLRLRGGQLLAQARKMAAGDMAGLVGQHADDLVRRLRLHQRAGIDEDAPPVHHEGVEGALVDDDDLDVLLRQSGGAQDRLGIVAQQLLDLGVADDRHAARRRLRVAPACLRVATAPAVTSASSARRWRRASPS